MRNAFLKKLNKIEFVVTDACTGHCKHCSQGEHSACTTRISSQMAAEAVRSIAAEYDIETVMTFGGEPLLHTEAVYAVMRAATELRIPRRQVITNGYFSKSIEKMREAAQQLAACGVNDLLLSVDVFHQETIPLDIVKFFAAEAKTCGIPVRLSPAWLVSASADNSYNRQTREILAEFAALEIPTGVGNVIFPEGNALKHLSEYFNADRPANPYVEDQRDVRCISFSSNGDVLNGNAYESDVMTIIKNYAP